jgi:hypothetical protein
MDMKENNPNNNVPGVHIHYYDALERVLSERPILKAPRNTSQRVLARLAALQPAEAQVMMATRVKYAPPTALPLPDIEDEDSLPINRRLGFYLFALGWVSLLIGLGALAWFFVLSPLLNGDKFGLIFWILDTQDGLMSYGRNMLDLFAHAAPYLPSFLSLIAGLVIMLLIFRVQRYRETA